MTTQNDNQSTASNALKNLRMRLLDLTARNSLINFRHSKGKSLRLINEFPNQLVEVLLSEKEVRFLPIPEPKEKELIAEGFLKFDKVSKQTVRLRKNPTAKEWAKHLGFSTDFDVPELYSNDDLNKYSYKTIQTLLYPFELEARLKTLLQNAETAIQEMGANILYMVFGFLEWYDNNTDNSRLAPLFLVPVRLHKGRLNPKTKTYEYTLSYSGEDIIPNLSLREKLRIDFGMALPDLDENTEPEDYFKEVLDLIKDNQPHWRICRYISLALLNFSKLLMYLDLDPARWPKDANIIEHSVVSRFLLGDEKNTDIDDNSEGGYIGFGEEYPIDEMEDIHTKYPLIDDADSSQHSALIDAVNGRNLVIEGPPGTGKSQTITNLIAAAMAQGKKVLFVAEKLAALEVVRSRLDAVGLGEFCLELHSHKSQKRKVLDEISVRLKKHRRYRKPKDIEVDIARYEELKEVLKAHAEKINSLWKNTGKTRHEIFMGAVRYRKQMDSNSEFFYPDGYCGDNYDLATQYRNEDYVEFYKKAYKIVVSELDIKVAITEHPWFGAKNSELQIFDWDKVKGLLCSWQETLQTLKSSLAQIANTLDCETSDIALSLTEVNDFLIDLKGISSIKGDEILVLLPELRGKILANAQNYFNLFLEIQELYATLPKEIDKDIIQNSILVEQLFTEGKKFKKLLNQNVQLFDLSKTINYLISFQEQLEQYNEPMKGIIDALGDVALEYLTISEFGLIEYRRVIEIISSLPSSYWQYRNILFDNEELDILLPQLRKDIEELKELQAKLQDFFILDELPSYSDILKLKSTLVAGGLFRWFKGTWKAARKQLLSFVINPQIKLSIIESRLGELAEFSAKYQAFENNIYYKQNLGDTFQGLETDVVALEYLRAWYKLVRKEYGVGFGKKVAFGEAILGIPENIARAVRSLSEQGIQQEITELLDNLNILKEIFSPVFELRNGETPLIGRDGIISYLLKSVNDAMEICTPLVSDGSMTVAQLVHSIDQIRLLKEKIDIWKKLDLDRTIFKGHFRLIIGTDLDNSVGVSVFKHTLELAVFIDKELKNQKLINFIYSNPNNDTFLLLKSLASQLEEKMQLYLEAYNAFSTFVQLDWSRWTNLIGDNIDDLISRNQLALNNHESLLNWLDYIRVREQIEKVGFRNLVSGVENGTISIEKIEDIYKASIYDMLAREILKEEPELSKFSGRTQEALQDKFRDYDNKLKKLQCELIAWKIDKTKIPMGVRGAKVSEHTERVLLEHECGKKTRHIPIRQLLRRSCNALVALKPCFMMGPMSVAQYIAPGAISFDLVVMDEASQIKPQDALGAIARGSQLVVVGDPKQLPPTSFFDRVIDDGDEDPTAIEESESILDATLPMFAARRLRWHYRSQHESLIAFSNYSFYDGDLVLFPSPHKQTDDYGIQYYRVKQGCFINRRNMEEAKIISEAVREHFKYRPEETLGVVAMSADQRLQIERAIETLAKEDQVFQGWLDTDGTRRESLFVKNLENVQGDERDVIFISMTYGPKEPGGKVFQRFGPINSDMGWRRLNVLFTRSRKRMHIFSSLDSDDIVIGSTSKRGVRALRDFLTFCETGILHKTEQESGRTPDSDFEIAVMSALKNEGFECIPQVGVAGFFIDIAVVDPGNPGRFLMGIECDGATYHSAKSARDRDRLRQSILERLGWNIRRIWSTDWFKNPNGELRPIIKELNNLKSMIHSSDKNVVNSEGNLIEDIIANVEIQESGLAKFAFNENSLRDKLIQFDQEVIRNEFPDTPENKRLLRPEMLEILIEYTPTSKVEFFEIVPLAIRQSTERVEGKYLEQIFDIINASLGDKEIKDAK